MERADWRLRAPQVARLCEVRYSCLDYWLRSGALACETPAGGRGRNRRFTFLDVIRARALARLRAEGLPLQTVRKAVAILTEKMGIDDPLTAGRLLVANGRAWWAADDRALVDILTGQGAIRDFVLLDVGALARETAERIRTMAA